MNVADLYFLGMHGSGFRGAPSTEELRQGVFSYRPITGTRPAG